MREPDPWLSLLISPHEARVKIDIDSSRCFKHFSLLLSSPNIKQRGGQKINYKLSKLKLPGVILGGLSGTSSRFDLDLI